MLVDGIPWVEKRDIAKRYFLDVEKLRLRYPDSTGSITDEKGQESEVTIPGPFSSDGKCKEPLPEISYMDLIVEDL